MHPFPTSAARLYLTAANPPARGLAPPPRAPSPAAVHAAERQLRRLSLTAGASPALQRQRALAAMVLGLGEGQRGDLASARRDLAQAAAWPPIHDAATAALVGLLAQAHNDAGVLAAADRFPLAPNDAFYPQIAWPAAQAAARLQQWPAALRWTRHLPSQPAVVWIETQAQAATGQAHAAALLHRELIYRFPASPEARQALPLWQQDLATWPELAPAWEGIATQARSWTTAGNAQRAAQDWTVATQRAPAARQAALEASAARSWLAAGQTDTAQSLVQALLSGSERPQALELQVEIARRRPSAPDLAAPLQSLAAEFPTSPWYARALHEAADQALIESDAAATQARFDRLRQAFPHSAYAPNAAWQAAWVAYRLRQPGTPRRLEQYLTQFPHGPQAVDALYWRGEWARTHRQPRLAQACFRAAAHRFPGTYFGLQAQALVSPKVKPSPLPAWLRDFQADPPTPRAAPIPAAFRADLARATWLREAGLAQPAATIVHSVLLRQPRGAASLVVARQLATLDSTRSAWHEGLEAMLRALPGYLDLHPWQLTRRDWTLLFPVAFSPDLRLVARHFGLDRNLLLGLIRQESGFNPNSVSNAHARGLMQLELATARGQISRLPHAWRALAPPEPLRSPALLNPGLNLALGTAELRRLLEEFHQPVLALAAYNAGDFRVRQWQLAFPRLSPNEFIESIPFAQTRAYVQGVLRNQAHYRRLYGK